MVEHLDSVIELKDRLDIAFSHDATYLVAVAIHKQKDMNPISRISCKKGIPMTGYVHDVLSDSYCIECSDYLQLGKVPASFFVRMPGTHWQMRIPMPDSVLKKYMSVQQRQDLKNFKSIFKSESHRIELIQMIDPN